MTSRERVRKALNHQTPDRVPIDVWGSASRLCDRLYFDIVRDQKWQDLGKFVSASRSGNYMDERVADLIDCDFRHLQFGKAKYFAPTVDADGVALAAIQGLNQKLDETRAENADLKARLEKLEQLLNHKLNGGAK